jgi:hypothetical protein
MRTLIAIFVALCAGHALAQSATLLRADTLRAEPFADAAPVVQAAAGDAVRMLERRGTWSQVEAAGKRGWVRGLNLRPEGTAGLKREGVLALETGRQAQGGVAVPLAIRNVQIPGPAARLLEDIQEGRDRARAIKLSARRAADGALSVELQSPRAGYAYVFMAPNAGDSLQCVFPNAVQPDNEVSAGKPVTLPSAGWRLAHEGAARVVAVVTDAPLDLLIADKQADGPLFKLSVSAENRESLGKALAGSAAYGAASAAVPARK